MKNYLRDFMDDKKNVWFNPFRRARLFGGDFLYDISTMPLYFLYNNSITTQSIESRRIVLVRKSKTGFADAYIKFR